MAQQTQALASQLLGTSPGIVAIREKVEHLLRQSVGHRLPPILIRGETGTGKGLLARAIHDGGPRRDGPFVDINCAAIPEALLESELFGFERGAFTDARRAKPGLFQAAHRGVIFLDEIGLLPETLQAKLLKVIEDRAVRRLGSTEPEPVDVAIVTATNEDLPAAVRAHRFREDLYHRLAVLTLELPPLRARQEDILPLAQHFLDRTCAEYGLASKTLTSDAKAALLAYHWPGNVRELANVLERAALLAEAPTLTPAALGLKTAAARRPDVPGSNVTDVIARTLEETGWNISQSAARLGIARNTLKARIRKYRLRPGGRSTAPAEPPPDGTSAPRPAGVQWESRRLALLRTALVAEGGPSAADSARALDMLIQKVEAFGGRLLEISVAGIVAAFGLEPIEDAPRRAALAALAMQKAARRGGGEAGSRATTVAIHAALVPVAHVGSTAEIEGEARRRIWSTLDALVTAAEPGAILVSRPTMSLLARRFDVATTAIETPWGLAHRLTDYRATAFDVGGFMAGFVGRATELELLRTRLEAARGGRGQVVALVGDPGIGKSRLVYEFSQGLAELPVTYCEGHCVSYGTAIPYLPILEVIRGVCRLDESDTPETIADKVRARAGTGASYVLRLLGIEDETSRLAALTPEVLRARTFEALRGLLFAATQHEPIALVVEDLHWIDTASEEVLASLIDMVSGAHVLLVCTYRPGYRPAWTDRSYVTQVALAPLAPDDSRSIVRVVLGTGELADSLEKAILSKAEGNPFFLEELARAAREHDAAAGTPAAPDTVQEVLLARIDRLPEVERRLLQSAAVIGKEFELDILQAIADEPRETVRESLRHLQASEFVHETGLTPESEYTFRHFLTYEVAYRSLPDDDRGYLHGRVVSTLERLTPEERAERAEVLAAHTLRAEIWDKAVDYLRLAGAKAWKRGALQEALARYEEALAVVARAPADDDMARRSIDVRLDLHAPLMTVGRTKEIAGLYPEAERLARGLGDGRRLCQVMQRMSQVAWLGGQYRRGAECAQQALAVGEKASDAVTLLQAHYYLGLHRHALADYGGAIPCFARLVEGTDAQTASKVILVTVPMDVPARCWLGFSHAMTGDFVSAETYLRMGVEAADASDFPQARVIARTMEAIVLSYAGRAHECLDEFRLTVELCERIGFFVWLAAAYSTLGFVLTRVGQPAAALPHLERAVSLNEKTGVRTYHAQRLAWWAEGLLRAGRVGDACRHADAAVELAGKMEERGIEAEALLVRGLIARAQTTTEGSARAWLERALEASVTAGTRLFEAQAHRELGELLAQASTSAEARHHLETADRMFREMRLA